MNLKKTIHIALITGVFMNSAMPAFARVGMEDERETISWTARFNKLAGRDVSQYADEKARIIASKAGETVRNKVLDIFFKDNERYGIDADGRRVNIYTNKSGLLNNLFKKVTGTDLDETLKSVLPLGSLYVNKLREKMDHLIVEQLLGSVVNLGVEEVVYRAVTGAYNIGSAKLQDMTSQFTQSLRSKSKTDAQVTLEKTYSDVKKSKLDTLQSSDEEKKDQVKATAATLLENDNDTEITLSNVLSYYKNKFLSYIDNTLKDTMISAIGSAAKSIGAAVSDATINMIKGPSTVTGALIGWFVNPAAGLFTAVTGYVTGMYQDTITDVVSAQAESRARHVAHMALSSKQLIEHQETQYTVRTETLDNGMEFEIIDEVDHSIAAWANQKLASVKSTIESISNAAKLASETVVNTTLAIKEVIENADMKAGTQQAAQYLNKAYAGYDPLDIQANIRPLTATEIEINAEAKKKILHPRKNPKSAFYNMSKSEVEALTGSIGDRYDAEVEAWSDAFDEEVSRIKKERARVEAEKNPSFFTKVSNWFFS